ncbi:MAG: hypothetical protein AMXMBFR36_18400 [Acidobacteriota bacterium]
MSVPSKVWPPLRRLPIVLLVVLSGCRSAPLPPAAPPPPPEPPPIVLPPIPDVVGETRRIEEALETVEIELAPSEAAVPVESPAPDESALPAPASEPADPPDPPALA